MFGLQDVRASNPPCLQARVSIDFGFSLSPSPSMVHGNRAHIEHKNLISPSCFSDFGSIKLCVLANKPLF